MSTQAVLQVRKNSSRIEIVDGREDPEAVHSFMHDCLVPLLAREFFRLRNADHSGLNTVRTNEPTRGFLVREDGLKA